MRPTTTTDEFLDHLRPHAEKPLVFDLDGHRIRAGYHVTEVKAAQFASLDCGANPEQWHETIIQLWDVPDTENEPHMTVSKFLAIYKQVTRRVPVDGAARLTFECGDLTSPAVQYTAEGLTTDGAEVLVRLEPIRATCKPRDREADAPSFASGLTLLNILESGSCCAPAATPGIAPSGACS